MSGAVRDRMANDLRDAVRARDAVRVGVLRTTLAALANAEAVDLAQVDATETEVPRRVLDDLTVRRVIEDEHRDLLAAADQMRELGQSREAAELDARADVLRAYLGEATGDIEASVAFRLRAGGCVFAEEEARLLVAAASSSTQLDELVRRRVAGEPVEQLVGWAELAGVRVRIDPGVFVPRFRTRLLVQTAIRLLGRVGTAEPDELDRRRTPAGRARPGQPVVLDLCCGSGAIALALARAVPDLELHAADIDPVAVACARRNLDGLGAVHQGDLFDAVPAGLRGRIDLVVANVPYVPSDHVRLLPAESREHQPLAALDGGPDGLDVLRRVLGSARAWLAPGGYLVSEVSVGQAAAARLACVRAGLVGYTVHSEELEATVLVAARPVDRLGTAAG